ncbi:ExbD/TolR family protein [Pedobacter immunditicola]|uniref:ExbD/TolR family protein n=1 Tax=Pedobacter immunditicola TaxID=3133440 RepID=UPI0030991976
MARPKIKRQATAVDMTAMCDVSFLLLNFFVMTSTAIVPDPVDIKIPSSTYKIKVPDTDLSILTLGKEGQVFYETIGQDIKIATLEKMGEQYNIEFTPEEKKRFSVIAGFGVPIQSLKQYIALDTDGRKKSGLNVGIPTDSTNNQLSSWLLNSRKAVAELHSTPMRVSIKGEQSQPYPQFKKIVDILQDQKINKFSLVTTSEG